MHFSQRRLLGAFAFFSIVLSLAATPAWAQRNRLPGPIQSRERVTIPGQVPAQLRSASDDGPAEAGFVLPEITLVLRLSEAQQADLANLLAEQQDPESPNYHQWLTPEEFAQRFGAAPDDIARISDWLRQQGLQVLSVARARNSIQVRGTVQAVRQAFSTEIHRYRDGGEPHFANSTDPAIPADLSMMIAAIQGLDDFRMEPRNVAARLNTPVEPKYNVGSSRRLSPADFATIYNVRPLYNLGLDGSGQKIVVAGQTAIDLADFRTFRTTFGLAQNDPQIVLVPGFPNPGVSTDDLSEANLDLQWAGGIAPNAQLLYVYSGNVMNAVRYAIDQNLAPVISVSYGLCEQRTSSASMNAYQSWARQANAQGITWVNAAGDSGGPDCFRNPPDFAGLAVDAPASVPEVTAIGGTTLSGINSSNWSVTNGSKGESALSYIPETAWNDSFGSYIAAGGGGSSTSFPKPSWQIGTGVPDTTGRKVPDISLAASPNTLAYVVYVSGAQTPLGGTSAGTPAFAAILSLLNQYLVQTGQSAGLGNINPRLYTLAQTTPSVFHDIINGNNIVRTTCAVNVINCGAGDWGYSAAFGYDLATGLGSINAFNLVTSWSQQNGPKSRAIPVLSTSPIPVSALRSRGPGTASISSSIAQPVALAVTADAASTTPDSPAVEATPPLPQTSVPNSIAATSRPLTSISGVFVDSNTVRTSVRKGSIGETLTIYVTGSGLLATPPPEVVPPEKAASSSNLAQPAVEIGVTVGGITAPIISRASAPGIVGVIQVTFRIPEGVVPGANPMVIYVSNGSTISTTLEVAASK